MATKTPAAASADGAVSGVSTDTRSIGAGQLFVALRGERFDPRHDHRPDRAP